MIERKATFIRICIGLVMTAVRFDPCANSVCLFHTFKQIVHWKIDSKTNLFRSGRIGFIAVSKIVLTGRDTTLRAEVKSIVQ